MDKPMSSILSQASTLVSDKEIKDVYDKDPSTFDDNWLLALRSSILFADGEISYKEAESSFASAMEQPATPKSPAAYRYVSQQCVLQLLKGFSATAGTIPFLQNNHNQQPMIDHLQGLNAQIGDYIKLTTLEVESLAMACIDAGVPHPGQTDHALSVWTLDEFRAFCKLWKRAGRTSTYGQWRSRG
jgi:hypothetical protein